MLHFRAMSLAYCLIIMASLLVFSVAGMTSKASTDFAQYRMKFERSYEPGSAEFIERQALFHKRLEFITAHNARSDRLWTAGLNGLTDRTDQELAQLRGWRGHSAGHRATAPALLAKNTKVQKAPSKEVDWRGLTMAADVPDQGGCGSCWAVATASMLQGRLEVHNNGTTGRSFSAQQLINCVPNPKECGGSGGCSGATVELAMQYVERMGLEDAEKQPYFGQDMHCAQPLPAASFLEGGVRHRRKFTGGANVGLQGWSKLPENKALPLMLAAMEGPVAISVGASEWSFYDKGIFNGCSKDSIVDHAVTLFGYGEENGVKYWNVRNSWGSAWGERGYIRLLRQNTPEEDDKFCGTDTDPGAGLACKPYPQKVTVCGMCGMLYDSVAAHF